MREQQLQNVIRNDVEIGNFIKKVIALPFLPHEDIEQAFNEILTAASQRVQNVLRRFISYYRRQWINIVTPKGFSIFGLVRRTNNAIESYHARLNHRMGRHPTPWSFTCNFI